MIIKYENYTLTPEPNANGRFNIEVERTNDLNKVGVKNKTRNVQLAYGCSFDSSLRTIAEDILAQENREVNFDEYINRFNEELHKITTLLK
jgi:hypothetical protein